MRASALELCAAALVAFGALPDAAHAVEPVLDLHVGYNHLTNARSSANAVFGSAGGVSFGGGVRVLLGQRFYVGADGGFFEKTGERVFAAGPEAPVFGLGHPLEVRLIPVRLSVGYRFRPEARLVPYVGLGGGFTSYREESSVGGLTERVSETKASFHALAGVEWGRGPVRVGLEAVYSLVPDAIGIGGVSALYDETDVGGFSVAGKLSFGRRR